MTEFIKTEQTKKKKDKIVTNTLYTEKCLEIGESMVTGPASTTHLFEIGSFNFTMNWSDLFKHEYQFSQTRNLEMPKVLDIGCRTGEHRIISYRNMHHIDYTGIDIDKNSLKKQYNTFTT